MKYVFLFLVIVISSSCSNSSKRKISEQDRFRGFENVLKEDIPEIKVKESPQKIEITDNDVPINLDKIIDSVYYIKLQTLKASLIGKIDKMLVLDNYIIILDKNIAQSVFLFKKNGQFITKVSRMGRSPSEYIHLQDISFNDQTQKILIYDNYAGKVLYYNLKGEFINSEKVYFQCARIGILPNQNFLFVLQKGSNAHIPKIAEYNLVFGTPKSLSNKALLINSKFEALKRESITNFNISQNEILYSPDFSDTIYSISSHSIKAKYYINSDKDIKNFIRASTNKDDFSKMLNSGDYYYFQGFCSEVPTALYFEILREHTLRYFWLKQSKTLIGGSSYTFSNSSKIKYFSYPFTSFKNYFIGIIEPAEIKNSVNEDSKNDHRQYANLFNSVKKGDNPILIFYSVK